MYEMVPVSLIPMFSRNANSTHVESLVSFLCKHDIIKIGLNRKVTFCVFNQLCVQHLVCMIFNPRQLDTGSKLA